MQTFYGRWAVNPGSKYYDTIALQRQLRLTDDAIQQSIIDKWAADGLAAYSLAQKHRVIP